MSECSAEAINLTIAELAFSAVLAGIPILEIPNYVQHKLNLEYKYTDKQIDNALKILSSNESIVTRRSN
jgi:hypothetical protein